MKVFNINLGIGEASSGVEYAQSYRSDVLNSIKDIEPYFVFLDWMPKKSVYSLTEQIGIFSEQVIWFYDVLRGSIVHKDKGIKYCNLQNEYDINSKHKTDDNELKLTIDEASYIIARRHDCEDGWYRTVDLIVNDRLVAKDYYSDGHVYAKELYRINSKTGYATCYRRLLFDEVGSVVLVESVKAEYNSTFLYKGVYYPNKEQLFKAMLGMIGLEKDSKVLLDRATGTLRALLELKKTTDFDLSVVVHADHYVKDGTDEKGIVWNNYYEYAFRYADKINSFICSTDIQSKLLDDQLRRYRDIQATIATIPVGFLRKVPNQSLQRDRNKFLTVSRLAPEKKLDVLIKAFARSVKETSNPIHLDVYGDGVEKERLKDLIISLDLESSVTLKGHHSMKGVYEEYSTYLSASATEGFGLSLMEAMGAGLFMIGFDVPYGNQTFMNTEGGTLIEGHPDEEFAVERLSQAILDSLLIEDEKMIRLNQYFQAGDYDFFNIVDKWRDFLYVGVV